MTWCLNEVVPDVSADAGLGLGVVVEAVVGQTLLADGPALVPGRQAGEGGDHLHGEVRPRELQQSMSGETLGTKY